MADVAAALADWSTTASSNAPTDATTIGAGLADNFQQIQATVRAGLASKGADIASATTTDIGAVSGKQHHITGTTTITSLGTVAAGIEKVLTFDGALTLTHNATSLILPRGANITTLAGDVGVFVSEGSGNWRCVSYSSKNAFVNGSLYGNSYSVSVPTATPTTLFDVTSVLTGGGSLLVTGWNQTASGAGSFFGAVTQDKNGTYSVALITNTAGIGIALTMSGSNLQLTHTIGTTHTFAGSAITLQ